MTIRFDNSIDRHDQVNRVTDGQVGLRLVSLSGDSNMGLAAFNRLDEHSANTHLPAFEITNNAPASSDTTVVAGVAPLRSIGLPLFRPPGSNDSKTKDQEPPLWLFPLSPELFSALKLKQFLDRKPSERS